MLCSKIFRVSNDPEEGYTGIGDSGWHIDGTLQQSPYLVSVYHMPHVPREGGETAFVDLDKVCRAAHRRS